MLAPAKPAVPVAAMRPATSMAAYGPQNLLDAVAVARTPGARGVMVGADAGPASAMSPGQARLELWLRLLGAPVSARPGGG